MNFNISGAAVYFRIPTGIPILGDFLISETLVVSWIVMILITGLCIWLTRGPEGREYIQTAGSGRDAGRTGTEVCEK